MATHPTIPPNDGGPKGPTGYFLVNFIWSKLFYFNGIFQVPVKGGIGII